MSNTNLNPGASFFTGKQQKGVGLWKRGLKFESLNLIVVVWSKGLLLTYPFLYPFLNVATLFNTLINHIFAFFNKTNHKKHTKYLLLFGTRSSLLYSSPHTRPRRYRRIASSTGSSNDLNRRERCNWMQRVDR